MLLIKANVDRATPDQLVFTAHVVTGKMTGNANFASPTPALAEITAATATLANAIEAAKSGAHADIAARRLAVKPLRALLASLARYVNSASNGDLNIALTSGFTEAKGHEPIVHLDAPKDLRTELIANEGAVQLRWKGSRGARMYQVYMSTAQAPDTWQALMTVSRTKQLVTGLTSGGYYTFRVSALGAAGESVPSDIVKAKAA